MKISVLDSLIAACSWRRRRETFVTGNPDHVAAARAIFAVVDPLNFTVPFNGVSGRSDRAPPFPV